MDQDALLELLRAVRDGRLSAEAALPRVAELDVAALRGTGPAFARVDHGRAARCGFPEVVYAPGKTPGQVAAVAVEILARSPRLLVTRLDDAQWAALAAAVPDAARNVRARTARVDRAAGELRGRGGCVALVSAGTADEPVAEEARETAEALGATVVARYDCGVAGLARLVGVLPDLHAADVVVVVAGMDGALASVVGGLVDVPVVAVPTSVGYGASFEGVGPLLNMLASCAAGVAVVNIDNGFGAGYLAATIARRTARAPVPVRPAGAPQPAPDPTAHPTE